MAGRYVVGVGGGSKIVAKPISRNHNRYTTVGRWIKSIRDAARSPSVSSCVIDSRCGEVEEINSKLPGCMGFTTETSERSRKGR